MYKSILFIILWAVTISCGSQQQLKKSYNGKSVTVLEQEFGKPISIMERAEDKIYIYEKKEELKSTEISQGKMTLDPIVTPGVQKTKRFYFTVRNGIIVESKLEEEYQR
jgi:hypothetical protein